MALIDSVDRAQHAVLDAQLLVVAGKDDAVSACKGTQAGLRPKDRFRRVVARCAQGLPYRLIECEHVLAPMGEGELRDGCIMRVAVSDVLLEQGGERGLPLRTVA